MSTRARPREGEAATGLSVPGNSEVQSVHARAHRNPRPPLRLAGRALCRATGKVLWSLSLRGSRPAVANAADENSAGLRNRRPYEAHEPTPLASVRMESRRSAKRRVTAQLHVKECERRVRRSDVAVQGHGLSANVRRPDRRLRTAAGLGNRAETGLSAGTRRGDESPRSSRLGQRCAPRSI